MGEIVGTVKANGDPWVVIHAADADEFVALTDSAIEGGVFEATGRAAAAMRSRLALGDIGAVPISSEPTQGYQAPPQQYAPPAPQYGQAPQPQYQQPQQNYGQAPAQQFAPQGPPPGEDAVKPCPHGGKTWRAGKNRQGKDYAGWFCPSQDRAIQCPAEYPRR